MEELQETGLKESPEIMTYKVRPGIIDLGRDYEFKIATLLSLRGVLAPQEEMWIGMNVTDAGYFDDIVLRLGEIAYLIQVKHKQNARPIIRQELTSTKGDFCLARYVKSIAEVHKSLYTSEESQFKPYLSSFRNIRFIIFTNRSLNDYDFLKESLSKTICFLNTRGRMHKVNATKLEQAIIDDIMYFDNFYLLTSQISARNIDQEIEKEFGNISNYFNLPLTDIANIAENYTKFIVNWGEGKLGAHYYLTKKEILLKVTELFLEKYKVELVDKPFQFYNDSNKCIWNRLLKNKTVTIVNSDKNTIKFIEEYLGNEVQDRCDSCPFSSDMLWGSRSIPRTSCSFSNKYQHHFNQIAKSHDLIRPIDIYKCLVIACELPFLLEITTANQYENILKILKLSKNKYKVIVINKSGENCLSNEKGHFSTFRDLEENDRELILGFNVALQGRLSTVLTKVVDESMWEFIDTNDIINILCNNFNIGNDLRPTLDHFVERKVSKIFIMSSAIEMLQDEIFIIKGGHDAYCSMGRRNVYKWEDPKFDFTTNGKICYFQESFPNKTVHIVTPVNLIYMAWENSYGSRKCIKHFIVNLDTEQELDLQKMLTSNVTILSAKPGMGKSTLVDYLAYNITTDKWVVKVALSRHKDYYENCKETLHKCSDHLASLNNSASQTKLANAVFTKFQSSKNVALLLDGFDEVSELHQKIVLQIVKSLYEEGYYILITTRPHKEDLLEKAFDTFSTVLKPFSTNDQQRYLLQRFSSYNSDFNVNAFTINKFIYNLLEACRDNLNDFKENFTGVPLQIKLLADVVLDDYEATGRMNGSVMQNLNLFDLYEKFINKKIDVVCKKFQDSSSRDMFKLYKNHLLLFALRKSFPSHENDILEIKKQSECYDECGEFAQLEKVGTRMLDENFIHHTFSDYLAAQWLAKNDGTQNIQLSRIVQILLKSRSEQKYTFLFKAFDHMVSQNRSYE